MSWYATGTVTVTNGSPTVSGASTLWVDVGTLNPGDIFYAPDGKLYQILTINSNTGITLASNYLGSSLGGQAYSIMPIGLLPSTLAQQVKTTLATANLALASTVRYDINSMGLTLTQAQNARTNIAALSALDVGAGRLVKSVAGGVDVTLSAVEASAQFVELTGTITANINVIVPAAARTFFVYNGTTGAFTVTVKTAAGTGVIVPNAARVMLECDATNVINPISTFSSLTLTHATNPTLHYTWANSTARGFYFEGVANNARIYSDNLSAVIQSWDVTTGAVAINYPLSVTGVLSAGGTTATDVVTWNKSGGGVGHLYSDGGGIGFLDGTAAAGNGMYVYSTGNALWWQISGAEKMRLDSNGALLVGKTAVGGTGGGFELVYGTGLNSSLGISHATSAPSGNFYMGFNYAGTNIGGITQSGTTAVLYNTTCDYRTKSDPRLMTPAESGAFIDALIPREWTWTADGTRGAGFIAHEFQQVSPTSVNGEKDEMQEQTYEVTPAVQGTFDADGNVLIEAAPAVMGTRMVPKYQSMQASSAEVMANIVCEIQSLRVRTAALEATLH